MSSTHPLIWGDVGAFLLFCGIALLRSPRTTFFWLGLGLAGAMLPLWVTARVQLGRSFSFGAEASRLVTTGLYSRFRHPIYLFGGIAYFGALLALQYWPLFWLWLALTPLQVLRMRRENAALRAAFGEEFERHRSRTWL
jgi:protein-S-isoprenylcysteine O-methyltransferase Ste14